jgi:hypothetical protein
MQRSCRRSMAGLHGGVSARFATNECVRIGELRLEDGPTTALGGGFKRAHERNGRPSHDRVYVLEGMCHVCSEGLVGHQSRRIMGREQLDGGLADLGVAIPEVRGYGACVLRESILIEPREHLSDRAAQLRVCKMGHEWTRSLCGYGWSVKQHESLHGCKSTCVLTGALNHADKKRGVSGQQVWSTFREGLNAFHAHILKLILIERCGERWRSLDQRFFVQLSEGVSGGAADLYIRVAQLRTEPLSNGSCASAREA